MGTRSIGIVLATLLLFARAPGEPLPADFPGSEAGRGAGSYRSPFAAPPHYGPVQLLGIEPDAWDQRALDTPEELGGAVQVQYPLDNEAYSGPDASQTPYPATTAPATPGFSTVTPEQNWLTFSSATAEATWLPGGSSADALGIASTELRGRIEFPGLPMLTLMPRGAAHWIDGPTATDLPPRLYDASLETILSLPLGEHLFLQGAVSPSLFTDGSNVSGDALRLPGRVLLFWTCRPKLTLSGGIVYLDREDIGFLPAAGVIYKPSDDVKAEFILPRPKLSWRCHSDTAVDDWVYLAGELGGGSWAIERAAGQEDVAALSDYRILAGWERTSKESFSIRAEAGYVFNRTLEYANAPGQLDLAGTGLVRLAVSY